MNPFVTTEASRRLTGQYPDSELVLALIKENDKAALGGFCQQWNSEGVPHFFRQNPMLYETVRDWIARQLGIHGKELTIIGSARIGYSVAPEKFGRKFGRHSDLDLVAISPKLFERAHEECKRIASDWESGALKPTARWEKVHWPEDVVDLNRTANTRGFINTWDMPYRAAYPLAKRIAHICQEVVERLKDTDAGYEVKKASLRVYSDLASFIKQTRINLKPPN